MTESWYARTILPLLLETACSARQVQDQRRRVVPQAQGRVVEIGLGTGLNLPFYDPARVSEVIGVDPAGSMLRRARRRAGEVAFPVSLKAVSGELLPFEAGEADTVVCTYALCTIPDPEAALAEMRRVLKPGGRLLFVEHGAAPDAGVRRWQDRLNGPWGRIAGGCNLNRPIFALIEGAGFRLQGRDSGYLPRLPKPLAYNYLGAAEATEN